MPTLYEYFGLTFFFNADDHEPIHIHIEKGTRRQGDTKEIKAVFIINEGVFEAIRFEEIKGRRPLSTSDVNLAEELLLAKKDEILKSWTDFYVLRKRISPTIITKRLK
jgi:hypothetical protein